MIFNLFKKSLPVPEKVQALEEIEAELREVRLRNEQRLAAAKEALGTRYVCHPSHKLNFKRGQHV